MLVLEQQYQDTSHVDTGRSKMYININKIILHISKDLVLKKNLYLVYLYYYLTFLGTIIEIGSQTLRVVCNL